MSLLDSTDYDSIRRALSLSLDSDTLPDADIEDARVLVAAETYIGTRVDVDSLTQEQAAHAENAARYYAAYLLAPAVQGQLAAAHAIKAGQAAGGVPNWRTLADELLKRVEMELGYIVNPTLPTPGMVQMSILRGPRY